MSVARTTIDRASPRRVPDRAQTRAPARSPQPAAAGAMVLAQRGVGAVARHPLPVLVGLAVATFVASVGWNALMLQTSKHPAPLFGKPAVDVARRPEPAPAPLPVPRPAVQAPATLPVAEPAPRVQGGDPIGTLIRSGEPARPADPQRVSAAQSALTKLGLGPLKSDGVMGSGTKQALERFEREHNLPVTGTLAVRTTKLLTQITGIAID